MFNTVVNFTFDRLLAPGWNPAQMRAGMNAPFDRAYVQKERTDIEGLVALASGRVLKAADEKLDKGAWTTGAVAALVSGHKQHIDDWLHFIFMKLFVNLKSKVPTTNGNRVDLKGVLTYVIGQYFSGSKKQQFDALRVEIQKVEAKAKQLNIELPIRTDIGATIQQLRKMREVAVATEDNGMFPIDESQYSPELSSRLKDLDELISGAENIFRFFKDITGSMFALAFPSGKDDFGVPNVGYYSGFLEVGYLSDQLAGVFANNMLPMIRDARPDTESTKLAGALAGKLVNLLKVPSSKAKETALKAKETALLEKFPTINEALVHLLSDGLQDAGVQKLHGAAHEYLQDVLVGALDHMQKQASGPHFISEFILRLAQVYPEKVMALHRQLKDLGDLSNSKDKVKPLILELFAEVGFTGPKTLPLSSLAQEYMWPTLVDLAVDQLIKYYPDIKAPLAQWEELSTSLVAQRRSLSATWGEEALLVGNFCSFAAVKLKKLLLENIDDLSQDKYQAEIKGDLKELFDDLGIALDDSTLDFVLGDVSDFCSKKDGLRKLLGIDLVSNVIESFLLKKVLEQGSRSNIVRLLKETTSSCLDSLPCDKVLGAENDWAAFKKTKGFETEVKTLLAAVGVKEDSIPLVPAKLCKKVYASLTKSMAYSLRRKFMKYLNLRAFLESNTDSSRMASKAIAEGLSKKVVKLLGSGKVIDKLVKSDIEEIKPWAAPLADEVLAGVSSHAKVQEQLTSQLVIAVNHVASAVAQSSPFLGQEDEAFSTDIVMGLLHKSLASLHSSAKPQDAAAYIKEVTDSILGHLYPNGVQDNPYIDEVRSMLTSSFNSLFDDIATPEKRKQLVLSLLKPKIAAPTGKDLDATLERSLVEAVETAIKSGITATWKQWHQTWNVKVQSLFGKTALQGKQGLDAVSRFLFITMLGTALTIMFGWIWNITIARVMHNAVGIIEKEQAVVVAQDLIRDTVEALKRKPAPTPMDQLRRDVDQQLPELVRGTPIFYVTHLLPTQYLIARGVKSCASKILTPDKKPLHGLLQGIELVV